MKFQTEATKNDCIQIESPERIGMARQRRLAWDSVTKSLSRSSGQTTWSAGCGCQSACRLWPPQMGSTKETRLAPNPRTQGRSDRETGGERDSENNLAFYSFSLSAYCVLDPGTMDILILTAKDQLLTLMIVAPY